MANPVRAASIVLYGFCNYFVLSKFFCIDATHNALQCIKFTYHAADKISFGKICSPYNIVFFCLIQMEFICNPCTKFLKTQFFSAMLPREPIKITFSSLASQFSKPVFKSSFQKNLASSSLARSTFFPTMFYAVQILRDNINNCEKIWQKISLRIFKTETF